MSGDPNDVDAKLAEVERSRKVRLWAMRMVSLVTALLVVSATALQIANDLANFVPVSWWLSLPCFLVGVLDVVIEYGVRRRVPLVEGRSEHLHFVRLKIRELDEVLGRYETLRREPGFVPEISTENEVTSILAALREHTERLTYEESTLVVKVPPASGSARPIGTLGP